MKYLMFDTETTNDIECPLCYDFGYSVIDKEGKVYKKGSYVVADVFLDKNLMASAYFADKIPQYWADIRNGTRQLRKWKTIKAKIKKVMRKYDITYVVAHNTRFDYKSTTTTQRYLTCSKWRYFFPYGTQYLDTLKMARQIFGADEDYIKFCTDHNFLTSLNKPKLTAEVLYRYITNNPTFVECHTGLEDVEIEMQIFLECIKRNPQVEGRLWADPSG